MRILVLALMIIVIFGTTTVAYASDHSNTSGYWISLDRNVYPVPFGEIQNFEDTSSLHIDGKSLVPVHHTAIPSGNMQEKHTLGSGDLTLYIRIHDSDFDISSETTARFLKMFLAKMLVH